LGGKKGGKIQEVYKTKNRIKIYDVNPHAKNQISTLKIKTEEVILL
jgi:hypothetical protein